MTYSLWVSYGPVHPGTSRHIIESSFNTKISLRQLISIFCVGNKILNSDQEFRDSCLRVLYVLTRPDWFQWESVGICFRHFCPACKIGRRTNCLLQQIGSNIPSTANYWRNNECVEPSEMAWRPWSTWDHLGSPWFLGQRLLRVAPDGDLLELQQGYFTNPWKSRNPVVSLLRKYMHLCYDIIMNCDLW